MNAHVRSSAAHGPANSTVEARREADLNQRALKHWNVIYHMLVDLRGRPLAELRRLADPAATIDPERYPNNGPRLNMFTGLSSYGWANRGTGHQGDDAVSLIQFLAGEGCSREAARDYLERLLDRVVVLA